jgi:hypothetical protein
MKENYDFSYILEFKTPGSGFLYGWLFIAAAAAVWRK